MNTEKTASLITISCSLALLACLFTWISISDMSELSTYRQEPGLGVTITATSIVVMCLAPLEGLSVFVLLSFGIKAALISDVLLTIVHWIAAMTLWKSKLGRGLIAGVAILCGLNFFAVLPILLEFMRRDYLPITRLAVGVLGAFSLIYYGWATTHLLVHYVLGERGRLNSQPIA